MDFFALHFWLAIHAKAETLNMVEGFWIVQFEGVQGNGGGVVFFVKGRIYGGDSGFVYIGTYQTDGKTITGHVKVRNFLPEIQSVLGVPGDYELNFKGNVAGQTIQGSAAPFSHSFDSAMPETCFTRRDYSRLDLAGADARADYWL